MAGVGSRDQTTEDLESHSKEPLGASAEKGNDQIWVFSSLFWCREEIELRGERQRQVERLEDECNRGERGGWPDHRNDSTDGEKEVESQYT